MEKSIKRHPARTAATLQADMANTTAALRQLVIPAAGETDVNSLTVAVRLLEDGALEGENGPCNATRAGWASAALMAFAAKTWQDQRKGEPACEIITDLLADMMHLWDALCRPGGPTFSDLYERAVNHYSFEINEECSENID